MQKLSAHFWHQGAMMGKQSGRDVREQPERPLRPLS